MIHRSMDTRTSLPAVAVKRQKGHAGLMGNDLVVEAKGLRKSYGAVAAVDGLDLEMARGEVLSLLGPNGAGKTTTVEILEGYRRRDNGEVRVLGEDPQRAGTEWRARRGIVLQNNEDVADLSVSESVRHFARFYPSPADPADVIERVGLSAKRDARIRTLSGGQRRRLDVALGIIGGPELLFLDEPTTGFDPEARRTFWDLVRDLAKEGTSVLLTTHYLEEAEALADRVASSTTADSSRRVRPASSAGANTPRRRFLGWSKASGGTLRRLSPRRSSASSRRHLAVRCRG